MSISEDYNAIQKAEQTLGRKLTDENEMLAVLNIDRRKRGNIGVQSKTFGEPQHAMNMNSNNQELENMRDDLRRQAKREGNELIDYTGSTYEDLLLYIASGGKKNKVKL